MSAHVHWSHVPLMDGVRAWAQQGLVTGASARNWSAYGHEVSLAASCAVQDQALLCDPQTSGGLLVSCAPQAVGHVLDVFKRHGFAHASEIGAMHERSPSGAGAALVVD